MAEKRYYWLKLYDDFFNSKRIKKLRSIAGGDTYTIIYLKMQLKSLRSDGYLYFDGVMDDFAEELALDIDENVDDVKVTISFLLSVGLMESNAAGAQYKLTYVENVTGSETASAQRVREHRIKLKNDEALHCNAPVTEVKQVCNAEKEIETRDKRQEKEKSIKRFTPPTIEEACAYFAELGGTADEADKFYDYYTSNGWKVGNRGSMKDWKASARNWMRNNRNWEQKGNFRPKRPDYETVKPKQYSQESADKAKAEYERLLEEIQNE